MKPFQRNNFTLFLAFLFALGMALIAFSSTPDQTTDPKKVAPPSASDDSSQRIDEFIKKFNKDTSDIDQRLNDLFDKDFFNHFDDPFKEMEMIRKQMEERFKQFSPPIDDQFNQGFDSWFDQRFDRAAEGKIDTSEDDKHVYVSIDAGDMNPKDVKVDIKGETVTVSGKTDVSESKDENGIKSQKKYVSSFSRSFAVPDGVDANKADVEIKDKKIVISFPKK